MRKCNLFNTGEWQALDRCDARATSAGRHALQACLGIPLRLFILCLVLVIEYELIYSIFYWLKKPMPGEESVVSVMLLSLTPLAMVLAFHALAREIPDGVLVKTVTICAGLTIFIWGAGAGGVLASTLWYDGANILFTSGTDGSVTGGVQTFFEEAAKQEEPGAMRTFLEEHAFRLLGACFVLGAGGLTMCVLYLSHRLIEGVSDRIPAIHRLITARETVQEVRRLYEIDRRLHEIGCRKAALKRQYERAERDVAGHIAAILNRSDRDTRKELLEAEFAAHPDAPRFIPQDTGSAVAGANIAAINRCLANLAAYATTEKIINDIRRHGGEELI